MLFMVILIIAASCQTTVSISDDVNTQRVERLQTHRILIRFRADEGPKRVLYRYAHLRMEMLGQLQGEPLAIVFNIQCTAEEIDGFLHKLEQDQEIISATLYE